MQVKLADLLGTSLIRAGRDMELMFLTIFVVLLAYAIMAEQIFGSQIAQFSSLSSAFLHLWVMMSGAKPTFEAMMRVNPIIAILFFLSFFFLFIFVLIPVILAIITDAYVVRKMQVQLFQEQLDATEREEEAKRERKREEMRERGIDPDAEEKAKAREAKRRRKTRRLERDRLKSEGQWLYAIMWYKFSKAEKADA